MDGVKANSKQCNIFCANCIRFVVQLFVILFSFSYDEDGMNKSEFSEIYLLLYAYIHTKKNNIVINITVIVLLLINYNKL